MCSQDSVEEGVGGDGGISSRNVCMRRRAVRAQCMIAWVASDMRGDCDPWQHSSEHADPHALMPLRGIARNPPRSQGARARILLSRAPRCSSRTHHGFGSGKECPAHVGPPARARSRAEGHGAHSRITVTIRAAHNRRTAGCKHNVITVGHPRSARRR